MKNALLLSLFSFFGQGSSNAQLQKTSLNDGWHYRSSFSGDDKAEQVTLPYHWNCDACILPDYCRGEVTYQKEFYLSSDDETYEHFVLFEGVNTLATIILNSKILRIRAHSYMEFVVDLSSDLQYNSNNKIEVSVDNRNTDIHALLGKSMYWSAFEIE